MNDINALKNEFLISAKLVANATELENLKREWLGKEGKIKSIFKILKDLSADEKAKFASGANELKEEIEKFITSKAQQIARQADEQKLSSEFIDLSLPAKESGIGRVHPVRLIERRIEQLLLPFGFNIVEGPELETEYYCFDALNIPKHHPARDMQDTFYTDTNKAEGPLHVLRTHTTSVQARELEKKKLPLKVISCGRVYRNETEDSSHQAMFHQYELVWIEEGLTTAHLMGIITHVLKGLYGEQRKVRFVPKFYPYTEPSLGAQIDCTICNGQGCSACSGAGWVTILGSGMVHRAVFKEFGYDADKVSGIAFGLGTARLAAQFYNSPNLKILYDADLRVLNNI